MRRVEEVYVYKMVTFGEVSLWSLITGAMLYDG